MSPRRKKVLVLGAGMIGSAIARDLAADPALRVDVADARADAVARVAALAPVGRLRTDLDRPGAARRLADGYDLVLGALPSLIGFGTVRSAVEAGRAIVDISFMPEDARRLDSLAQRNGVTAVVDCGVAPGLSNMMAGAAASRLDPPERLEILVGGLPVERRWPFDYRPASHRGT